MPSTYSTNFRFELIGSGEQQGTWGTTTNTNLGTLIEEAIGGYVTVTVADSALGTTLTANNGTSDQSRNMIINLTSAGNLTATREVFCPAIEKLYVVRNATTNNFPVTFRVANSNVITHPGVSIPNGSTYLLYVDATDVRAVNGTIASQNANSVSITGGSIVANASSLGVRDSDGSHVLSVAAGSNLTANRVLTLTTGDVDRTLDISASNVTVTVAGAALIDDADAAAQRTTLGLGTVATQDANNVAITGGSITGITDLALADGGTGASLSDPNADAILGWNDTANVMRFFTAGTGITINATSNTISSTVSTSGALIRAPQILSSGTSYTTPAGCNSIYVEAVGGGGGGGGTDSSSSTTSEGGGGGGAGGYAAKYFSVSPSTAYTYAIGAGGTAGDATGGSGGNGGNTTFVVGATTLTAGGGSGGSGIISAGQPGESGSSLGGAGGTSSSGDLNVSGGAGGTGVSSGPTAITRGTGGVGANSFFGGGGRGAYEDGAGSAGSSGGGGGGGSNSFDTTGAAGGAGGAGLIRIWEYT